MERIIAGRFQTGRDADAAARLIAGFVDSADICVFYNSPPGQHSTSEFAAQEPGGAGTDGAGRSAVTTAVAAGLVAGTAGMLGDPLVALAAAGVGAYAGYRWSAHWTAWASRMRVRRLRNIARPV